MVPAKWRKAIYVLMEICHLSWLVLEFINIFRTWSNNSAKQDFETLGISRNASEKEIKEAFYKLAKKYHPDNNKDDKDAVKKFQEISNAYECIISNKEFLKNPDFAGGKEQNSSSQENTQTSERYRKSYNYYEYSEKYRNYSDEYMKSHTRQKAKEAYHNKKYYQNKGKIKEDLRHRMEMGDFSGPEWDNFFKYERQSENVKKDHRWDYEKSVNPKIRYRMKSTMNQWENAPEKEKDIYISPIRLMVILIIVLETLRAIWMM